MAYFAKLDDQNKVIGVHTVNNNITTVDGEEDAELGIKFLIDLHGSGLYKQTSYNGTIRKNYAGKGYTYDQARDAFIPPKPLPSWVLNEDTCRWDAPVPEPDDGKMYIWDEPTTSWVEEVD